MKLIVIVVWAAVALGARWFRLHPEKIIPKGYFVSFNCPTARMFRVMAALIGSFFVIGGVMGAISSLFNLLTISPIVVNRIAPAVGLIVGIAAAFYVHREVRLQPPRESDTPFGWWP